MNCPNCSIALIQKNIQGIQIDECEKCEGIWLEEAELRQVKDKIDSDLNWMDFEILKHPEKFKPKAKRTACPSCKKAMSVLDYDETKVEIDYCTECKGVWLEKNELESIIEALEKELLTKSLGEYVSETLGEAKDLLTGPESFLSEWKDFSTILRFMQYRILSLQPKIHDTIVTFQNNPLNR
ncbi:MAG: zf-TFIIB domain-containing protein [Candidatus Marinimicrobia bacterium]|nr:zf-TFIIB domain-containing protein [Candidatus Neomarinimicrobiota bacterium]MCF7921930.1 zf-TFIIB domain-containing protein [Candidatus Neomarinimicrobiota bacterium]